MDMNDNTVLHYAAKYGRFLIVQEIVERHRMSVTRKNRDGFTAAHLAAACGSLEIIQCLHRAGDSLVALNNTRWTPLHFALKYKHKDIVAYLIRNNCAFVEGCDIVAHMASCATVENDLTLLQVILDSGFELSIANPVGWTILHFAAANGSEKAFEMLRDRITDSDVRARDIYQRTPLLQAAIGGHMSILIALESLGDDLYSDVDKYRKTALHYAAELGYVSMVKYLIKKIDPNSQDQSGMTPLHLAALNNQVEVIEALLSESEAVNVNEVDNLFRTPLYLACENSRAEALDALLKHGARHDIRPRNARSLISCAVIRRDPRVLESLLGIEDIDIFFPDMNNWTPVHYAAQLGRMSFLHLFYGLDPSCLTAKDTKGRTPFHIAALWNQIEVVCFCLDIEDFDPNVTDDDGNTALHLAVRRNYVQMAKLLQAHDVDLNIQNSMGQTPLHLAVISWASKIVSELASSDKCDLNIADDMGMTPLLRSAELGQSTIIGILMDTRRVQCDAVDRGGNGAAHFAALLQTAATLDTLRRFGKFDLYAQNAKGQTPLDLARRDKNAEITYFYQEIHSPQDDEEEEEEESAHNTDEDDSLVSPADQKLWRAMPKHGTLYDSSVCDEKEGQPEISESSEAHNREEYSPARRQDQDEMDSFLEMEMAANEEEDATESTPGDQAEEIETAQSDQDGPAAESISQS